MRLTIEHETHYRFEDQAKHSLQYIRLTPRRDVCQSAVSWTVSTPGHLVPWTDGFYNSAHLSIQDSPHHEITVHVEGVVDTFETNGVLAADDGLPPIIFLRETPYTGVDRDIAALAGQFAGGLADDGDVTTLHALMNGIEDAVSYQPGFTDVSTDAAGALARGHGVCQDHAHLFIACARALGVPARYVSGYLLAGTDNDSHLASHAWAEAFVDGLGWVSFDPSNRQSATEAYVRLAVGLDYGTAGPLRGIRHGGGSESLNVRVQVAQSQE